MKILELVALILISLFVFILLFGTYVLPEWKIQNEDRRNQYSYLLRACIWGTIYMLALDFIAMIVLTIAGRS